MDYKKIIGAMTLEEKASLCSGRDFWHTKAVKSQKIPEIMMSDGPHGLRKQPADQDHLGNFESIKAVCFPAACATAASFDRALINKMGKAVGVECQSEGIATVLGPAVNIKRSPLCGRNFEYFSEDPLLATEMSGAFIKGVQSKNIGTSIKHFLANNQETRRLTVSAEIDERTMREIYLAAFEGAIKNAKPWTVMCSYNRINGLHASENKTYLTDILRDEWGYEGIVMSDWGAVNDRVKGLAAGLDLEMPGSYGINDREIIEAVEKGSLSIKVLDNAVERILKWIDRYTSKKTKEVKWDKDADHELAGKIASESAVLLKNDGPVLPLDKNDTIAVIGKFAKAPRYQGGGSSHINSFKVTSFMDAAKGKGHDLIYADGYDLDKEDIDRTLITKAVNAAKKSDAAVIFAGLPDLFESEGYDRTHMRLPENQNTLIEEVLKVQSNVIVVLHNGSAVEMPWADKVKGILEMYLGGQNVGSAEYDILYGKVNPSGKLPETFPKKLSDNPSYLNFPGYQDKVYYSEGVFVGYRYYDTKKLDVLFPFGHGLSYTTYKYSNLKLSKRKIKAGDQLMVSVDVSNIGRMAGKEVVQLYVGALFDGINRPVHELRAFEKVSLRAGETKTVTFELDSRAFAYWSEDIHDWYVAPGDYNIEIGSSSRDIQYAKKVNIETNQRIPMKISENTCMGDLMGDPRYEEILKPLIRSYMHIDTKEKAKANEAITDKMGQELLKYSPLRGVISMGDGVYDHEKL
ncbi:MAG: glycoside hydrolase family 3 C-terminal domain-containing protein, partial [Lachnospiraceae bacterium]|nr:glycoside hydrolase family 3 C-terminal domain-containing protein [Lachnospiraceae bacterium]